MHRLLPALLLSLAAPAFAQPPSSDAVETTSQSAASAAPAAKTHARTRFGDAIAELTRVARERAAKEKAAASSPDGGEPAATPKAEAALTHGTAHRAIVADANGR